MDLKYFSINKPYGVLSQFTEEGGHPALGSLYDFPEGVYPVGRLDRDSEGLLVLTNDTRLNEALLHPKHKHERCYHVQVEGAPGQTELDRFLKPLEIKVKKQTWRTAPAQANLLPSDLYEERDPPVRFRANIPTAWLALHLKEGKNRQVRKMTAAIGFPTLRLVRYSIEDLTLDLQKEQVVKEWEQAAILEKLKLSLR